MSATRLLLVRHAEPDASGNGRCVGRLDIGLSGEGRDSAFLAARVLAELSLTALYSSPSRRAVETAQPLATAHGLTPHLDQRLLEIDFGRLEGLSYTEIERLDPVLYRRWMDAPTTVEFPGGESYELLRERALAALEEIRLRHPGETVALVAHAGPLRAMLAECLSMPGAAIFRLAQGYGAMSIVEWIDSIPVVKLLNGTPQAAALALAPTSGAPKPAGAEPAAAGLLERPLLPAGFDDSRARERRERADGWRFDAEGRAAVARAIAERRDIRRFRPDPLPEGILERLLEAAHQAPSVGLMQPWRFVVVRSAETKAAMQSLAARERLVQESYFDERARHYLELKIEGIREAPVSICVCCDRTAGGPEVLGRHTIPDTDLYSTCLAIENLWLLARAEGIGVGWVSFYRPGDVRALLGLPEQVVPVAWLCVGYPDERPVRPGLEAAGWQQRRPVAGFVHDEHWGELAPSAPGARKRPRAAAPQPPLLPDWWQRLAAAVTPGDPAAALRVRDASDELVKPAGSLGALEVMLERFAMAAGTPPPAQPRAAILVCAADHGVASQSVSLYPARVGAQVAEAAARGETAIGVLARGLGAELLVTDVGLRGPKLDGVVDRRVAPGSADITRGPALSEAQLREAVEAGFELASELAARCDVLVLGEIGIGNTTVAAALLAALTGRSPGEVCGRGTGLDAQGLAHKQAVVLAALEANIGPETDTLECLRRLGGLDLGALVGGMLGAAAARCPILLDGFATGVAALAACRLRPALRDYLIAGHRSAEPAHALVLTELGLEPLLDLRLRLGEASGAALALPLVGLAGRLHAEMSRFAEAEVEAGATNSSR